MTKEKRRRIIVIVGIAILVISCGFAIYESVGGTPQEIAILNINWSIDIPEGVEVIYYKDSGASFHGDGERFTLLSGGDAELSGNVLDLEFFEEGLSPRNVKFIKEIYDSLSDKKCLVIDLDHKLYSRMFAKNYELSAKAYFDELLIVYDSDLEIYCFFERHI